MPGRLRASGDQVMLFISSVRQRLSVVALDADEYCSALDALARVGIAGGATYDGILAHCALKAQAESIYTWNERDYARFGSEIAGRVQAP